MLSIIRQSENFKKALIKKYTLIKEKLPSDIKVSIEKIEEKEKKIENLTASFENELRQLELKYDKMISSVLDERKKEVVSLKSTIPNFWFIALSNHKIFKDFIHPNDENVLKSLIDIRFEKLNNGNDVKLIFEFEKNEVFSNENIEKIYFVNDEHIITEIKSTPINWLKKEKFFNTKERKIANKSKSYYVLIVIIIYINISYRYFFLII